MLFQKSISLLAGIGILCLCAVNALAQDNATSQQSSGTSSQGRWDSDASGCKVWNPAPAPNETVTWSGRCVNGFADGYGTETWYENGKIGNVITGTMVNGRFLGAVTVKYPNGNTYKGKLSGTGSGGPDGEGSITSPSGRVFRVRYLNGKRTWIFPDNPSSNEIRCSNLEFSYGSKEFRQCLSAIDEIEQQSEKLIYITTSDSGSEYYYDANSIRVADNQVTVWITQDAKRDKSVKFRTAKQRRIFDCGSEMSKLVQYVSYNSTGRVLDSYNPSRYDEEWEGVIPGSIGSSLFAAACANR